MNAAPESLAGTLLLPADDTVRLARGVVRLRAGTITAVECTPDDQPLPAADLGGESTLITPGFVDTHLHLPQFDSIGITGLELLDWLDRVIFPAEARWKDADFAAAMCERVADQLLAHGTTAIAAYATSHPAAARRAIEVLGGRGIAGFIGQVLMDQNAPAELCRPASEAVPAAASLAGCGRIEPIVSPRFAVSCSREMLTGAGDLAARLKQPVQTHLAETVRECALVQELHGLDYVEVYRRAGLLTTRCLLGHGIYLSPTDRAVLADHGSTIAHCPTANRFLRAGSMHREHLLAAGIPVSLGSDVAGGPDRSMVRVARAMIETAESLNTTTPTAAQCWAQITRQNAAALALNSGSLAPGLDADLLIIEPDTPWRSSPDPLATLLFAWDDRWLRHTLLRGRIAWSA